MVRMARLNQNRALLLEDEETVEKMGQGGRDM